MSVFEGLKHFRADEKVDGRLAFPRPEKMSKDLMVRLDAAREMAGVPFVITSSYREGDPKAHGRGEAVDIRCHDSRSRFMILRALFIVKFYRIGVYDKHIHADVAQPPDYPEQVVWWGESE